MATVSFPSSASVYELVRLRPEVRTQLEGLGVTDEFLGYRISDAARAVGVPPERIVALVDRVEPAPGEALVRGS